MNKTDLPPGPWHDEPDSVDFEVNGLPCRIRRMDAGYLCGYVGLPPGHKLHGVDYTGVNISVHGGLTYARAEGDYWYLGFDCAHYKDRVPGYSPAMSGGSANSSYPYRDIEYVTKEVTRLAVYLSLYDIAPDLAEVYDSSN